MDEELYECLAHEHTACLQYNFSLSDAEEFTDQAIGLQSAIQGNEVRTIAAIQLNL